MRKPTLRTVSRYLVVSLVAVVGAGIALHDWMASSQAEPVHFLAGTSLSGKPAPDFLLRDQNGQLISMAQLRGRLVVVTFLDATCTSECPITAQYLDWTAKFLGPSARDVAWLAISVNPSNTPADGAAFVAKNHVSIPLHVLLGTQELLAPLWRAYAVQVIPPAKPGGDIEHAIVTYLIDTGGREREVLDQAYDPKLAAQDLRALLAT